MADPCTADGYGAGPWGDMPYGGPGPGPGTPLPTASPFDVYCIGPCSQMQNIGFYDGVVTSPGDPDQVFIDAVPEDLSLRSGGPVGDFEAKLTIDSEVPPSFTLEWTAKFFQRPTDFLALADYHIFFGVVDETGPAAGLYFSDAGIAYTPAQGGPIQVLPGGHLIVAENEYYTVRLVGDTATGTLFVFITKTSSLAAIGHQLRYTLALLPSSMVPSATLGTTVSVKGTVTHEAWIEIDSICLGTGGIYPNLRPIADAGADQSLRLCAIGRLDGTASFDPEGATILYKWRLIDAPLGSSFGFDGTDGTTHPLTPTPTGFTSKLYSSFFEPGVTPLIEIGDVLVIAGEPYNIADIDGSDGDGYFITIDDELLPDSLTNVTFKILHQMGVGAPTAPKPSIYPDVAGVYKFDLTVFDGNLYSEPATTALIVLESPLPRGLVPDLSFLWNYLSDVWGIIEGKEVFETYFSAMAQVAATELLTLWQIDYNKSLRDIQRTVLRKWQHYDPSTVELSPEESTIRLIFGGCDSATLGAGTLAVTGLSIVITSDVHETVTIDFSSNMNVSQLAVFILSALRAKDARYVLTPIEDRDASGHILRLTAPFRFVIADGTTGIFTVDDANEMFAGTAGEVTGVQSYKLPRSTVGLGLVEGDLLTLGEESYRIARTIDDAGDQFPYQRLVLTDSVPLTAGTAWAVPSLATSKRLRFFSSLVTRGDLLFFELHGEGDAEILSCEVIGVTGARDGVVGFKAEAVDVAVAEKKEVFISKVTRLRYIYRDPLVSDVPYLQELIAAPQDDAVLRRNVDFYLETYRGLPCFRFEPVVWEEETPPDVLWAEFNYIDNRPVIEANFGIAAEFTLDDLAVLGGSIHLDYLSAVTGLWYAYFNGPTLFNLRAGTQILLGLPYAEKAGKIVDIRPDYSRAQGRILVADRENAEVVRSYTYPAALTLEINPATGLEYAINDTVETFAPLVSGAEIVDHKKDPKWFLPFLQQGRLYEVEKFFTFLVRVDSAAFNLAALTFVQQFIRRIKPTYTYPLFVVRKKIEDTTIIVSDARSYRGKLTLSTSAYFPHQTHATMYDQWRPGPVDGHTWSKYDCDSDDTTADPAYPGVQTVLWGYDKNYLSPEDYITVTCRITSVDPIPITYDSIFAYDQPVYQDCDPGLPIYITLDMSDPDPPTLSAGTWCTFYTL